MFTAELTPNTPAWEAREFFSENYRYLSELYPHKWVVVRAQKVFFVADTAEDMFRKAEALGMRRGSFFYKEITPVNHEDMPACQFDGIGL